MLTIWDSLFLSFSIPPNLWDNKKRRCEFIFFGIFSYYTYFTILIFYMEGHFSVIFHVFFVLFCSLKPYFIGLCTFLSKNVFFCYFMKLFSLISYDTILTRWWMSFQLSFSVLFPYFLRTFSVPNTYFFRTFLFLYVLYFRSVRKNK